MNVKLTGVFSTMSQALAATVLSDIAARVREKSFVTSLGEMVNIEGHYLSRTTYAGLASGAQHYNGESVWARDGTNDLQSKDAHKPAERGCRVTPDRRALSCMVHPSTPRPSFHTRFRA